MLLFLESFWVVIVLAIFAFVLVFLAMRYPLPQEMRSGNLWQLAAQYERYLGGMKGRFLKYFMRLAILFTVFAALANGLFILSKHS